MKITDLLNIKQVTTHVITKKPKQKKWVPPLQQMLDIMKKTTGKSTANNFEIADPAISLAESTRQSTDEIKLCEDCGHLILPEGIDSDTKCRIEEKWSILKEKVTGNSTKCDSH